VALRPRRSGTIRVSSGALNVNACSTSKRVAAAPRRAGNKGGGTGGAGLTGRTR
jgi:hypothetical protein